MATTKGKGAKAKKSTSKKNTERKNTQIPRGEWARFWDYKCEQCGKPMNIIDYLTGHVCHECTVKNQREAAGMKPMIDKRPKKSAKKKPIAKKSVKKRRK